MSDHGNHFDSSRAELFEALGHPVRVRILLSLEGKPMGFADLKKEVGIESSGHLQFHLGKLAGLVGTTSEGLYALNDDGREAIRVLKTTTLGNEVSPRGKAPSLRRRDWAKPLLGVLLIAVVVLAGVVVYQQDQIAALNGEIKTNPVAPCKQAFDRPLLKGLVSNATEFSALEVIFLTNSTSMACVSYAGGIGFDLTPIVRQLENGSYVQSSSVTVTAQKVNATFAAYSITAAQETKGIFQIQLPFVCFGPAIALAVGYSFHELNGTSIRVPIETTSCPSAGPTGSLVGISGMETAWVRIVAK